MREGGVYLKARSFNENVWRGKVGSSHGLEDSTIPARKGEVTMENGL